jgi:hypothetical protein
MNNDVYETVFVCTLGDQVHQFRRHYKISNESGTGPTQLQIATSIDNSVATLLKTLMSNQATYKGSMTSRVWTRPRTIATTVTTNTGVGGSPTDPLPRQVRGLITLRGFFANKTNRGRVYVPFPSEAFNDTDGTPTAGYVGNLDVLGTSLITTIVGSGVSPNQADLQPVLMKATYVNHDITSVVLTPLGSRLSRDKWATQRRGGSYGRPNVSPI